MRQKIINFTKTFLREEEGQTMVEYALIIALMAIALLTILFIFSETVRKVLYDDVVEKIRDAISRSLAFTFPDDMGVEP